MPTCWNWPKPCSTTMKAFDSGGYATSKWSSARSATSRVPEDRLACATSSRRSLSASSPSSGRSGPSSSSPAVDEDTAEVGDPDRDQKGGQRRQHRQGEIGRASCRERGE